MQSSLWKKSQLDKKEKNNIMKNVLLIGLGRFGRHIAMQLNQLGHEVMAVDWKEERVDKEMCIRDRLNIDPRKITWRRCVDMNDRQLRNVVDGLGGRTNGMPREDGYDITVASEIMAVLCLASDIKDLKERLSRIIIGYTSVSYTHLLLFPSYNLYAHTDKLLCLDIVYKIISYILCSFNKCWGF